MDQSMFHVAFVLQHMRRTCILEYQKYTNVLQAEMTQQHKSVWAVMIGERDIRLEYVCSILHTL
jgi:hypothetical protein